MSRWEQTLLNTSQDKMGFWGDASRDIHSLLTSSVSCLWPGVCDAQWPWRHGSMRNGQLPSHSHCLPLSLRSQTLREDNSNSNRSLSGLEAHFSWEGKVLYHCCLMGAASKVSLGSSWLPFPLHQASTANQHSWVCLR